MKILRSDQIREADAYTIENEPIVSTDLMERAANGLTDWIINKYDKRTKFGIFVGPGNNGGDGLVVARLLSGQNYHVEVYLVNFTKIFSEDYLINKDRLEKQNICSIVEISNIEQFPELNGETVVIDAIFGSGLTRPLKGLPLEIVDFINACNNEVIAVDIPSGLFGEENFRNNVEQRIIKANYTLTIQLPKLSFLFAENEQYIGEWTVIPIGLHPVFLKNIESDYLLVDNIEIKSVIKKRTKFSHKGNYGHALLISGSYGKMGAAILAARACLRTGLGLLTAHIPKVGYQIMQTASPETMISLDTHEEVFSKVELDNEYNAIGIGPGIDQKAASIKALTELLNIYHNPMVFDADALNILANNKEMLKKVPARSILTPHPKEFERLFGKSDNNFQRMELQIEMAKRHNVIIILKGAFTTTVCPDGKCYFNSTGNPGMATAGSGDVLTGMILSLLAQGYKPEKAAILGAYLHGLAGDLALNMQSEESLIANDIIESISDAFKRINE